MIYLVAIVRNNKVEIFTVFKNEREAREYFIGFCSKCGVTPKMGELALNKMESGVSVTITSPLPEDSITISFMEGSNA